MKATLSKKQRFFNQIKLTKDDDLYIGIDVHKTTYHIALYLNGGHAIDFITPADNIKICTTLKKLEPAIKNIVYEAILSTGYNRIKAVAIKAKAGPIKRVAPLPDIGIYICSALQTISFSADL